jgi:hypothetical protein
LPSSHEVVTVVMKNWLPLVSLPLLAMDSTPGPVCLRLKFSSGNFAPYDQGGDGACAHRDHGIWLLSKEQMISREGSSVS